MESLGNSLHLRSADPRLYEASIHRSKNRFRACYATRASISLPLLHRFRHPRVATRDVRSYVRHGDWLPSAAKRLGPGGPSGSQGGSRMRLAARESGRRKGATEQPRDPSSRLFVGTVPTSGKNAFRPIRYPSTPHPSFQPLFQRASRDTEPKITGTERNRNS